MSGIRQRTSRPSVRVSDSRIDCAASHRRGRPFARSASAGLSPQDRARPALESVLDHGGTVPSARVPRLIQHKREAFWFYRFLSPLYDQLGQPAVLDAGHARRGAGAGAARRPRAEDRRRRRRHRLRHRGHRRHVDAAPRHAARPEPAPAVAGAAEAGAAGVPRSCRATPRQLPFATDRFDRYVSCGSIEYWPDPAAAFAEAYRVLKPGGVDADGRPAAARAPAGQARSPTCGCCSRPRPTTAAGWPRRASPTSRPRYVAPDWTAQQYGIAIAGRKPAAGPSPAAATPRESVDEPMTARRWARWVAGSAAGAVFVPIGVAASPRARGAARGHDRRPARPHARSAGCGASPPAHDHRDDAAAWPASSRSPRTSSARCTARPSTCSGRWSPRLAVNVFIVGINQLTGRRDRPRQQAAAAAGGRRALASRRAARSSRVRACCRSCWRVTQGWIETVAVGVALAIGVGVLVPAAAPQALPGAAAASASRSCARWWSTSASTCTSRGGDDGRARACGR